MADRVEISYQDTKFSDVAVDGLFAGLVAGLVMAACLSVTALLRAEMPGMLFSRFYPAEAASPWTGFLMHLAVSGVYGILFGCVYYLACSLPRLVFFPRRTLALGIGYGVGLFILAWYVLLPASASPLRQLPFWDFGLAHLVYGLILGWRFGRI